MMNALWVMFLFHHQDVYDSIDISIDLSIRPKIGRSFEKGLGLVQRSPGCGILRFNITRTCAETALQA